MPVNDHLTWSEVKDFSPGLWEADDWLMPATAAQTMTDCYPQEGGGLRAFYAPTSLSVSGLVDPTNERVIGLHARGGIAARSGAPADATDRYLMTYRFNAAAGAGTKALPLLYRMDGTNNETTWTEIFINSGILTLQFATNDNNAPRQGSFRFFRQIAGSPNDSYVIAAVRYVGAQGAGRGAGIYRLNYNDLSSVQKAIEITPSFTVHGNTIKPYGALAIYQQRLLVADDDVLFFSNVGDSATFAAASFQEVDPSQDLPSIRVLIPAPPSDLLVLRDGAAQALLQGIITQPTTQLMSEGIFFAPGEQDATHSPDGIYVISSNGHVYVTDGVTFSSVSQQLNHFSQQSDFVGLGSLNYIGDFVFAPNGKVYHFPTKSWFKQTAIAGALHNVERFQRQIWGPVGTGQSFSLNKLIPFGSTPRVSTYTWKSAPLRTADGRQLEVREVQAYVRSYDTNATVAVTVNGKTVTRTCPTVGKQQLSFLFMQRGEVLDIQVVPTAGAGGEAPSIETLRFGFGAKAHLLPST
jgi:hypothetical protein